MEMDSLEKIPFQLFLYYSGSFDHIQFLEYVQNQAGRNLNQVDILTKIDCEHKKSNNNLLQTQEYISIMICKCFDFIICLFYTYQVLFKFKTLKIAFPLN